MDKPKKTIVDCATNTTYEVEMTDEEIAELEQIKADAEARLIEEEQAQADLEATKLSAKQKLISGEPLTEAEADTLVL